MHGFSCGLNYSVPDLEITKGFETKFDIKKLTILYDWNVFSIFNA